MTLKKKGKGGFNLIRKKILKPFLNFGVSSLDTSLEAAADPMTALERAYAQLRKENHARVYARLPWVYLFD